MSDLSRTIFSTVNEKMPQLNNNVKEKVSGEPLILKDGTGTCPENLTLIKC